MPTDSDAATPTEGQMGRPADAPDAATHAVVASAPADAPRQTLEQILLEGQEPTEEFLDAWNAAQNGPELPELSDEEFERQALEAPGDDGDPSTPE